MEQAGFLKVWKFVPPAFSGLIRTTASKGGKTLNEQFFKTNLTVFEGFRQSARSQPPRCMPRLLSYSLQARPVSLRG